MGTYEELKAAIQQVIRTNGNNEITGATLQNALLSIVNVVGANATFAGIATPNTNPGTADQNVFYLATEAGTYVNFNNIEINKGEAVILSNKTGNWVKNVSGFATQQQLTELESEVERFAAPIFNNTPMEEVSVLTQKQINNDGSLRDYVYDDIYLYSVEEGKPYQIKGYTIGSGIYLYAFYSSLDLSAETLVKLGHYVRGEAVVRNYEFAEIAPQGAKYLVVCSYRYDLAGVSRENKIRGYDAIYSSSIIQQINEVNTNLLKYINEKVVEIEENLSTKITYAGIAKQSTRPIEQQNIFYVARRPGVYTNFNNIEVYANEIAIFTNATGSWEKHSIEYPSDYLLGKATDGLFYRINRVSNFYQYNISQDGSLKEYPFDRINIYSVNEGETYKIKGQHIGSNINLYAFYSSETPSKESLVKMGVASEAVAEATDYDFVEVAPKGATHLAVTQYVNPYPGITDRLHAEKMFEANPPIFAVEISDNSVAVTRKYSPTEDLRVTLQKFGANNLMQIYSHGFIENDTKIPSFGQMVIEKKSGSDWIGPYVIKADNREGTYAGFTGGCHGYNGDQTGAKTADTMSVDILVDERTPSSGKCYANRVKVIVTNLIQGGNTKSNDGNGVNILQEVVTYDFREDKIHVSVEMTALEDLSFNTYYGMQVNNYYDSISFYSDNIVSSAWSDNPSTSNKNIQFIVCKSDDGRCVKAYLDVAGLGFKQYSNPNSYAFVSGAKAYYWLVFYNKSLSLSQGEKTYWSGYYQFLPDDKSVVA